MQNCKTQVGATAQKSSKSTSLFRQPCMLAMLLLCAVLSTQAQKKDTNRYFEAAYLGQDSTGNLKYGSYFFSTSNNGFPSIEETKALIIVDYKLNFTPVDSRMSIWIVEFKNKKEWLKWNHK